MIQHVKFQTTHPQRASSDPYLIHSWVTQVGDPPSTKIAGMGHPTGVVLTQKAAKGHRAKPNPRCPLDSICFSQETGLVASKSERTGPGQVAIILSKASTQLVATFLKTALRCR